MRRRGDYTIFGEAVSLAAMAGWLLWLVVTNKVRLFVHPRFTFLIAVAGVGIALMAGARLAKAIKQVDAGSHRYGSSLLVGTVLGLYSFTIPHTFGADVASRQGLNLTRYASSQGSFGGERFAARPTVTGTLDVSYLPGFGPPPRTQPQPTQSSGQPDGAAIKVTPLNFIDWMHRLYASGPQYEGRQLSMEGFLFVPPGAEQGEFAVARLVVTCHVADAYPDGLLAIAPSSDLPPGGWVHVTGVLETAQYHGQPVLRLHVETLTTMGPPDDPYIYP